MQWNELFVLELIGRHRAFSYRLERMEVNNEIFLSFHKVLAAIMKFLQFPSYFFIISNEHLNISPNPKKVF